MNIQLLILNVLIILQPDSMFSLLFNNFDPKAYFAHFNIIYLNSSNFNSSVYNKSYAFAIKFCVSWSKECQEAIRMFQMLAKDIFLWKSIIRLASIDCGIELNFNLCENYGNIVVPKFKFLPPFFNSSLSETNLKVTSMSSAFFKNKIINSLKAVINKKRDFLNWPNLDSLLINSQKDFIKLQISGINKVAPILVILEFKMSRISLEAILDFSSYTNYVTIRSAIYQNSKVLKELGIKSNERYPFVFQLFKNNDINLLFSSSSEDDEENRREIFDFIYRKFVPKNLNRSLSVASSCLPVHMSDLYKVIKSSLFKEISSLEMLNSTQLEALHGYFSILYKYFPFDNENFRRFMKRMSQWLRDRKSRSNMTVAHLLAIMKAGSEGFIPPVFSYTNCVGFRSGYPCSMWLLFHVLTVSEYNKHLNNDREQNNHLVLYKMRDYIKHFFKCRNCDDYFNQLSFNLEKELTFSNSSIFWLWKTHNLINSRISLQNLDNFKPQFPSKEQCPNCYLSPQNWDEKQVLIFLQNYYDKKNLIRYNSSNVIKIKVVIVLVWVAHFFILIN